MPNSIAGYLQANLSKESPIPLYKQILNLLEAYITSEDCQAGMRLPTETELETQLSISRVTIRQAMTEAVKAGIIVRVAGKGTFVVKNQTASPAYGFIGYVVHHLISSFNVQLLLSVERSLKSSGYHLIFTNSEGEVEKENLLLRNLKTRDMLGFIVQPSQAYQNQELIQLNQKGFPLVLIDREATNVQADLVCCDHFEGGRLVAQHLIDQGYSDIAFVSTDVMQVTSTANRYAGFRATVQQAGLQPRRPFIIKALGEVGYNEVINPVPYEDSAAYDEIAGLLSGPDRPQAIFAMNDVVALMVILSAKKLNLRIPEDIALVGYDNLDFSIRWNLTSIDQNTHFIGSEAAKQLLKRIRGDRGKPERIITAPHLIVRGSSTR
jgi:GntR family transcriptional regulator, arabinose operon transcriptional repressor